MCYNSKTSLCVWAIIFFVIAAALIALTIAFPFILNNLATKNVQLTPENFSTWAEIPGPHDLRVNRDYYLYNCTNTDEIYFAGTKPKCTEIGPISYYENSTYAQPQYGSKSIPGENGSKDSVSVDYDLNLLSYPPPSYINDTVSVVNQALFGLWYGAGNQASYSLATSGLYNVWEGFAVDAVNGAAALAAQLNFLLNQETFNTTLATTSLTDEQKVALWSDPIYGVSLTAPNALKTGKMHFSICFGIVDEADRVRIQGEIRTYFGMNWQQFWDWHNYWCNADTGIGYVALRKYEENCNATIDAPDFRTRCAFAQWAASNVTLVGGQQSVTQLDDSVLGYPEFNFYQTQMVLNDTLGNIEPTLYENQFQAVNFKDQRYMQLFNYTSDKENTLFYYSSMRTLMMTGEAYSPAQNVIIQDGKKMLDLSAFQAISQTLEISNQQAFMLYNYFTELNHKSLLRSTEYPGTNHGAILGLANFVTQTLAQTTNSLYNYLLPRGLYGIMSYLQIASQGQTCDQLSDTYFNNANVKAVICNSAANANLGINTTTGALFWSMVYLDRSATYNATLNGVGLTADLLADFYSDAGNYGTLLDGVMKSIKAQYSTYCATGKGDYCTDSELGLAQFAASAVTLNLPSGLSALGLQNTPTVQGFASLLGQDLPIAPEYAVFASRQGKPFTYDYVTALTNYQTALTVKYVQDMFFKQNTETNAFDNSLWRDYLRYIVIEIAFNGLFVKHTTYNVLHGYKDPLITTINETPIYKGGDPTQSDIVSLIDGPSDTNIAFFTGVDDYKYTKMYAEYNTSPTIKIKAPYRLGDGSTAQKILVNPWREDIPLKGTDASTFPPLLEEEKSIWAFVSDIMIPLRFLYKGTITKFGLEAFRYELDPQMLLKGDEYEPNKAFYLDKYDGFANMTSLKGAKVFACQPHYYGVHNDLKDKQSVIVNRTTGKEINPTHDNDQSYFYLEQTSGGQMEGYQKLQINILTENDVLFNMTSQPFDYFIPVVYANRYTNLTESQVNDLFGALKAGKAIKTFFFCAGPVFAVVFIALGIWFLVRRKNLDAGTADYKEVP